MTIKKCHASDPKGHLNTIEIALILIKFFYFKRNYTSSTEEPMRE
jgi:hypothetical protein